MNTVVDAIAVENAPRFGYVFGQVRVWGAVGWSAMTFISGFLLKTFGYDRMFSIYAIVNLLAPARAKATAQTFFAAITGIAGLAGLAAILLLTFPNHRDRHL